MRSNFQFRLIGTSDCLDFDDDDDSNVMMMMMMAVSAVVVDNGFCLRFAAEIQTKSAAY